MSIMPSMKDTGKKTNNMDKVLRHGESQVDHKLHTLAISTKARKMEKADLTGKMVHIMKEIL